MNIQIETFGDRHREWATRLSRERWAGPAVVTRGRLHRIDTLPGFVALAEGRPVGLLIYRIDDGQCEVVSLDAVVERQGVGTALLHAVCAHAASVGCARVWLITTNDNTPALRFYQRQGFELVALHKDALAESRKLKPQIPELGLDDIPLRDEIEFERKL